MNGKYWPNAVQDSADPGRIMKCLRNAIRSVRTPSGTNVLKDMGTRIARLRGWGIRTGLACIYGAPSWTPTMTAHVKSITLTAHSDTADDRLKMARNQRLPCQNLQLGGFGKWLSSGANPFAETNLRKGLFQRSHPNQPHIPGKARPKRQAREEHTPDPPTVSGRGRLLTHLMQGASWSCKWCA